ncbi:MAG: hypothetical protein AAF735_05910 [Myxococcota bacterium]
MRVSARRGEASCVDSSPEVPIIGLGKAATPLALCSHLALASASCSGEVHGAEEATKNGFDEIVAFTERPSNTECLAEPGALAERTAPRFLSDFPCVDKDDPRKVVDGVISYRPNVELWSDGATKRRYLAVPDGALIQRSLPCDVTSTDPCEPGEDWELPVGSVLIKEFILNDITVETRIYMRHTAELWQGYSYAWNDEQTNAELLETRETRTVSGQSWTYPGMDSCESCHTSAAGVTLGLETRQLNGTLEYSNGIEANQLATLDFIGLLSPGLDSPTAAIESYTKPGFDEDSSQTARAYLHANCSMCHRPNGGTFVSMDFRYDTSLAEMNVCDRPSWRSWPTLDDPRLVNPGNPERSVVLHRMTQNDTFSRMPPIGRTRVDDVGVTSVRRWIASLSGCTDSESP